MRWRLQAYLWMAPSSSSDTVSEASVLSCETCLCFPTAAALEPCFFLFPSLVWNWAFLNGALVCIYILMYVPSRVSMSSNIYVRM